MRTLYEFIIRHMQPFRPDGSRDQTTIPVRTCIKCFNVVDAFNHRLYSVDVGSAAGCHEYIGETCFLEMIRYGEQHCARCGIVWWDVAKLPEEEQKNSSHNVANENSACGRDERHGHRERRCLERKSASASQGSSAGAIEQEDFKYCHHFIRLNQGNATDVHRQSPNRGLNVGYKDRYSTQRESNQIWIQHRSRHSLSYLSSNRTFNVKLLCQWLTCARSLSLMPPSGTLQIPEPTMKHHINNAGTFPIYFKNKLPCRERQLILAHCATLHLLITSPDGDFGADFPGLDSRILEQFLPVNYARQFTDTPNGIFSFPASSLYQPGLWPDTETDPKDRYGRPLTDILDWLSEAFAHKDEKVFIWIPMQLYKLCPILRIFNTLGMLGQSRQIESLIAGILRYRNLKMQEIEAVWKFETASPPPPPVQHNIEIQRGFADPKIMWLFAENLKNNTSQKWRWDVTGEWSQMRREYWVYMARETKLNKLVYGPDLESWVEILEKTADRSAKLERLKDWIDKTSAIFGRTVLHPMSPILSGRHSYVESACAMRSEVCKANRE
ncbi:hypothetical protein K491DRAFT_732173 [Lophiostoma macrostomum CBS 122681]|uniref:Uncharacterized protein n=1 Tax=Lophiostoma macrostomum CBS 122681 TaxID=1314788 RepID=A0A6A6SQK3_9PLEO|nr:hypothetical protein K491DRAFT_732173 [Lophiostoma macrostomum CBS 122681]